MNDVPVSAALLGDVASPPESAPAAEQGTLSAEASAARAELDGLKADPGFIERYTSGSVEAKACMAELHKLAYPETAGDDAPMPTTPAERAQAAIEALRADPEFVKRYEAGDPLAVSEMQDLHAQANPEPLPFDFPEDVPIANIAKANELAGEVIENLSLDRDLARGAVSVLDKAVTARADAQGMPSPMDDLEIAHLDARLQAHFGDDYDAQMDRVEAALKRAGDGGAWLRQAILASGPTTALWAFQTLAALPGEPR